MPVVMGRERLRLWGVYVWKIEPKNVNKSRFVLNRAKYRDIMCIGHVNRYFRDS